MIIHTRSASVVVSVLRRLPEIDSPDALGRMMVAMTSQSESVPGLARQVVAHAGGLAGVETAQDEVRFYVPPGANVIDRAWMVTIRTKITVATDGKSETCLYTVNVRHDNPRRDVRLLAAALVAEAEQMCTTTIEFSPNCIDTLPYALQKALIKI